MDDANRKAAEQVYRTVADPTYGITNRLRGLRKEDVIVVGGLFDFMQEMLVAFRCPHTVITPAELDKVSFDPDRQVVILNCHLMDRSFAKTNIDAERPSEEEAERRLQQTLAEAGLDENNAPGAAIRARFQEVKFFAGSKYSMPALGRLGSFVRRGGWLFSTDWAILAVEAACPGTIRSVTQRTFEEVVEVRPTAMGLRHPLLEGAFSTQPPKARWWIETEGILFKVESPKGKVLVESNQLAARYGGNRNVLAAVEFDKGLIVHALCHGYLQKGATQDLSPMHRVLANFLMMRSKHNWDLEERRKAEAGK
jgi:hypothetical protein